MTVVHESEEFVTLIGELFAQRYAVVGVTNASMNAIADTRPDLLMADDRRPFTAWELARLARHHRELASVPLIVFTTDLVSVATQRTALVQHVDVHLLEIPFHLDELETFVARALVGRFAPTAVGL